VIFEIGQTYENNIGKYEVLAINQGAMDVRYTDGHEQTLSIPIQARIYENKMLQPLMVAQERPTHKQAGLQDYWTMGFLLNRLIYLGANLTKDKRDDFKDRYFNATNKELDFNQKGISYLRNGANQWGNQGVIRFTAESGELPLLKFSSDNNIPYPSNTEGIYEVKDIRYLFILLEHGFMLGSKQDKRHIIRSIPNSYIDYFNKGYSYAQR